MTTPSRRSSKTMNLLSIPIKKHCKVACHGVHLGITTKMDRFPIDHRIRHLAKVDPTENIVGSETRLLNKQIIISSAIKNYLCY